MGDISKNFNRSEFACQCGCGFDTVDAELLKVLERVREYFGKPVIPTSGCRCEARNEAEGGAPNSQHLYGRAADFKVSGVHADLVAATMMEWYPDRYGIGRYVGRTHIDTRTGPAARWDMR